MKKNKNLLSTIFNVVLLISCVFMGMSLIFNMNKRTAVSSHKQTTVIEQPENNEPGNDEPGNDEPGNDEPGNDEPGNGESDNEEIAQTSAQYFRFDDGRILGFSASGLEENLTNIVLPSSYSLGDMAERVETFDDFYDFEERAEYYNYNFSVQFEYENEEYSIRCESYSDYEELEDEASEDDGLFHLIEAFEDFFSSGEVDVTFYEQTFIDGDDYSVEEIYDFAFFDTNIVSVVIPNTVIEICEEAFGSCHSLENVVIPDSVTAIYDGVFEGCESLLSIDLPFNLSYVCRAFQSTGIESICYGSMIDHIFFDEFHGCNDLSTIILLSPDVPDLVGSFDFLPRNFSGTIYVPAESLQAYRTAWVSGISNYVSGFTADNIQAIEIDSVYESQDVRVTLYNVGILKLEDLDDLSNCSYAYYSFNENTCVVIVRYNGEEVQVQLSQDLSSFELDGELFTLVSL